MNIEKTPIKDLFIISPTVFKDDRGYFYESYNREKLVNYGLDINFIQDNQSYSTYGTLRGLHLQKGKYAQAKLVRVVKGEVLDIALDLRKESPTFGESFSINLSDINNKQLLIPRGFAHGFVVLSKEAIFQYKVDNPYHKESETGLIYNDPKINLNWKIPSSDIKLSPKDKLLPNFNTLIETL
ncbi:dTDP-4-dehydrorhamnose 3,5-epimerase [Halobacteriovorax marinus]|uniref:dTDP-4-dehydrorhamnose 3,5-epimerase n=1 Tax=Halobacteriovorax marinus TaxID=97084 RepID=UPI000BC34500|nr:dTDP-4-dehydrorhamnose 3,5-epimerase [Halobacteriovorax marinus]ATH06728.1 dTDP-4-dehydrorhamnose 3,5-epimerase [Halobacteriovorax marinus]